ncbi:MAG: hypothetical protein RIF33_02075 [Cyclobacteriaceae bacterium]
MDKALNEIGKLRNEMKVGFIEIENQLESNREMLMKIVESMGKVVETVSSFSNKVEKGFRAIEEALDNDLEQINSEISDIKKRLDKGNL